MRILLVAAAALSLAGCSGVIHRQAGIKGNEPVAITVDARQRLIISQQVPLVGGRPVTNSLRRFCAEPSPDVFTVLGVGASGGATLGFDRDAKTFNGAIQAAFSSAESGSAIARTQTISLIREMMFRTCERYLSGAITEEDFSIIAARDQRVMVSILAIEQLTGSITPPSVAIYATGNASTGFDPAETSQALAAQQAKVKTAQDAVAARKAEWDAIDKPAADKPAGECARVKAIKAAGTAWPTGDEAKHTACIKKEGEIETANADLASAQAILKGMLESASRGQGVSSAFTSAGAVKLSGSAPSEESVAEVADAVRDIVSYTFNQDETLLFCLQMLRKTDAELKPVRETCIDYLRTRVITDEADLVRRSGLTPEEVDRRKREGATRRTRNESVGTILHRCVKASPDAFAEALKGTSIDAAKLIDAAKISEIGANRAFRDLGEEKGNLLIEKANGVCKFVEGP